MAEINWIKLRVDMFDDDKIKIIQHAGRRRDPGSCGSVFLRLPVNATRRALS